MQKGVYNLNIIGHLLPIDGYYVRAEEALPMNYLQSLTHLYQPLIGPESLMLYQTLINEAELQKTAGLQTHHTLMNYLTLPLDRIYKARLKLEGIGLLKTFKEVNGDATVFTYDLQSPYSPNAFFQDAMLSTLLYHHVGEQRFEYLKNYFTSKVKEKSGQNITADFQDVFQTFIPEEKQIPVNSNVENERDGNLIEEEFRWLEQMLKQRMIPVRRVLTKENRILISQLRALYDLETFEIDKAVLWALTEENYLNREEFKVACHDIFKAKNNNKPIRLVEKNDAKQPEAIKQPQTKEEVLIQELETISPKQLLEDLSGGNHASEPDMKAIREVMTSQGLPAPVMNVLIHYVLLQTNMKLSKAYLEKIASHWSRAKLKTAREAMEFAKKEKMRFEEAKNKRSAGYQKPNQKDIVPDWYKEGAHKQKKPAERNEEQMSEEQLRIASLIKQYSEGN